eukprot:GHVQ01015199.1.p1 GENE.GHVQ01015199.1~~GHVQ01015199.1.p1  ORF type:complete len:699 (+),score=101.29 GHVQ01015199.1:209-2305(+)
MYISSSPSMYVCFLPPDIYQLTDHLSLLLTKQYIMEIFLSPCLHHRHTLLHHRVRTILHHHFPLTVALTIFLIAAVNTAQVHTISSSSHGRRYLRYQDHGSDSVDQEHIKQTSIDSSQRLGDSEDRAPLAVVSYEGHRNRPSHIPVSESYLGRQFVLCSDRSHQREDTNSEMNTGGFIQTNVPSFYDAAMALPRAAKTVLMVVPKAIKMTMNAVGAVYRTARDLPRTVMQNYKVISQYLKDLAIVYKNFLVMIDEYKTMYKEWSVPRADMKLAKAIADIIMPGSHFIQGMKEWYETPWDVNHLSGNYLQGIVWNRAEIPQKQKKNVRVQMRSSIWHYAQGTVGKCPNYEPLVIECYDGRQKNLSMVTTDVLARAYEIAIALYMEFGQPSEKDILSLPFPKHYGDEFTRKDKVYIIEQLNVRLVHKYKLTDLATLEVTKFLADKQQCSITRYVLNQLVKQPPPPPPAPVPAPPAATNISALISNTWNKVITGISSTVERTEVKPVEMFPMEWFITTVSALLCQRLLPEFFDWKDIVRLEEVLVRLLSLEHAESMQAETSDLIETRIKAQNREDMRQERREYTKESDKMQGTIRRYQASIQALEQINRETQRKINEVAAGITRGATERQQKDKAKSEREQEERQRQRDRREREREERERKREERERERERESDRRTEEREERQRQRDSRSEERQKQKYGV